MDMVQIEEKIRMLIAKCQTLEEENLQLHQQVANVAQQCEALQGKNDHAILSVEKIIKRLKVQEK